MKFEETLFPAKEVKSTMSNWTSSNDPPISESDNESDNLGLELVIPAQPPSRPPSPGLSASRSQLQTHPNPPIAPPVVPQGTQPSGSGQGPTIPEPPKPRYSLRPTKEQLAHQPQPSGDNILINMFQEAPNSYQEALNSEDSERWLAASQEEFDSLTEMGVWMLVN